MSEEKELSQRERQIVDLASAGMSNRQIAAQVGLTEGTVKGYLHKAFRKLGITRRQHLILQAANRLKEKTRPEGADQVKLN